MIFGLAALLAGICALPAPAPEADPAAAAVYLRVGDGELQARSSESALVAYGEAVRLDPRNRTAAESYLAVCRLQAREAGFAEGRRRMDAGDCAGALPLLEAARANPEAALLAAICRYDRGDDDEARSLLETATTSPSTDVRARYFLGLIELRDGSGRTAAALFDRVSDADDEVLRDRAEVLHAAALRSGRAVVSAQVESGYDSNPTFEQDPLLSTPDGAGAGGLALSLRPRGLSGPYLRASAFYRWHLKTRDQDLGVFGSQLGWRLGRGETYAFADGGAELTLLGGAQLLRAARVRGGGRWQIGRLALSTVYAARFGSYQTFSSAPYSGVLHSLSPEVGLRLPLGSSIAAGYELERDATQSSVTSAWGQGPYLAVRYTIRPTLRTSAEGGLLFRFFDGPSSGATEARRDTVRYLIADLEKDLGRFTLRLSGGARSTGSNQPGFGFSRFTASLGLIYTLGIL